MSQPSVGGQQTVTGRRGRAPVPRCRRRASPRRPWAGSWLRRVPAGGGCCGAAPVGSLSQSAAEGLLQPLCGFLFSFSLSPNPSNLSFLKKDNFFPSLLFFFFFPLQEPRRGKTGWWRREKPLPFPSPVAPSSEKKHLGGFLPSAPRSRSRRRGARPPRGRGGPAGQPRRLR